MQFDHPSIPFSIPVRHFNDGSKVEIHGQAFDNGVHGSFSIDFLIGQDIALHFKVQTKYHGNKIVLNSCVAGHWQREESHHHMLQEFHNNRSFQLKIRCEDHHFQIKVNGHQVCNFHHRMQYQHIDMIRISEDIDVSRVVLHNIERGYSTMASQDVVKSVKDIRASFENLSHGGGSHHHYSSGQTATYRSASSGYSSGSTTIGSTTHGGGYVSEHTTIGSTAISNGAAYATNGSAYVLQGRTQLIHGSNISTEKENEYFFTLNERLAKYIETVRALTMSRDQLILTIKDTESSETNIKASLEALYQKRIDDLEGTLADLRSHNQSLANQLQTALNDYRHQHDLVLKHRAELEQLNKELHFAKTQVEECQTKIRVVELRVFEAQEISKGLKQEEADYENQINDLQVKIREQDHLYHQKQKDYELMKADLTRVKSDFAKEIGSAKYNHVVDINQVVIQLQSEYDAQLLKKLRILHADFESRLRSALAIEDFHIRFGALNDQGKHLVDEYLHLKKEVISKKEEIVYLEAAIATHGKIVGALDDRIRDLGHLKHYGHDFGQVYLHSLRELESRVQEMRHRYNHLLEIKTQLVAELNTYHSYLEAEEYRLNIDKWWGRVHEEYKIIQTVVPTVSTVHTGHTGRAYTSNGHSDVDLVFDEVKMNGDYIRLTNKGHQDFNLASWMIKAEANGQIRKFKFQSNQVVAPGRSMTIWSPNRGGTNSPPDSIVMKAVVWPTGNNIRVELLDESEVRCAWFTVGHNIEKQVF